MVPYVSVLSRRRFNSTGPDQWTRKGSDEEPKGREDRRATAARLLRKTEQRGEMIFAFSHSFGPLSAVYSNMFHHHTT